MEIFENEVLMHMQDMYFGEEIGKQYHWEPYWTKQREIQKQDKDSHQKKREDHEKKEDHESIMKQ